MDKKRKKLAPIVKENLFKNKHFVFHGGLSSAKVIDYILEYLNAANGYCGSRIEFGESGSGGVSDE